MIFGFKREKKAKRKASHAVFTKHSTETIRKLYDTQSRDNIIYVHIYFLQEVYFCTALIFVGDAISIQ